MPAEEAHEPRYCLLCREDLTGLDAADCPNCARPFDPEDDASTSPHARAYCVRCAYDMRGVNAGPCPECGAEYDPADAATYTTNPHARAQRRSALRILLGVTALALLALLVYETIIPRPAIRYDGSYAWTLWMWLDEPYGVEHERRGRGDFDVHYWAGEVTRVTSEQHDPATGARTTLFTVERTSDDTWRLDVAQRGVEWQTLLLAFNTTRERHEVFGVRIADAGRTFNEKPFTAQGPPRDIIQALIDAYELEISPATTPFRTEEVWVLDENDELTLIPVEEARAAGIFIPRISGRSITRAVARYR